MATSTRPARRYPGFTLAAALALAAGSVRAQPAQEEGPQAFPDAPPEEPPPPQDQAPPEPAPEAPEPAAAPAEPPKADAEEVSPLVPADEPARMSARPIDTAKLSFTPGDGFTAESADGDFALSLGLRGQVLYLLENDNAPGGEAEQSLLVRRMRIGSKGHVFGKNNKYKVELALSPRDVNTADGVPTTSPLLDMYFDFTHVRDLSLRAGQYKVPFNRQRVISSGSLQLVDRALTNSEFNLDRDIGLDLRSKDLLGLGLFRYYAGIYIGEGRNSFELNDFGMMYIVRGEVLPFGMFEDYEEGDFERTGPRLGIGASYAFLDNGPNDQGIIGDPPADGGTTDFSIFNADAIFKFAGLSVLTEFFYRVGERTPGPLLGTPDPDTGLLITTSPTRDGFGWLLQAGYLIPTTSLEILGRYAMVRGSSDPGNDGLTDEDELGGGVSYYFAQHSFKLQGDYFRLAEDGDYGDGTDRVRVQLQVAF